jgi:hypothetical protein
MEFKAFPDIGQFRNAVKSVERISAFVGLDEDGEPVYDRNKPKPTISYVGTVKLHGTNAAVAIDLNTNESHVQSRSRIITWESDNAGFAAFMEPKVPELKATVSHLGKDMMTGNNVVSIFGEWCGGNIQKGVAINGLEKMFVIFAVKHNSRWLTRPEREGIEWPSLGIYSNLRYPAYYIDIDFNEPDDSRKELADLTLEVEHQCPVGKAFGVEGIGEGIVWTPTDEPYNSSRLWFKVKGDKHSTSKVKKLASVDPEKLASVKEFVAAVVTDNRCEQAIHTITDGQPENFDQKMIGTFIRWVFDDIIKEESDVIQASGLEKKEVGSAVAKAAKKWMFANAL